MRTRSRSCPTFGVTYTGQYEFVAPIAAALDDLQKRTGLDVDIHVDAASGGFLAPFAAPDIVWDFRLPRVKSISTSGHKYGLVADRVRLGAVAGNAGPARGPGFFRAVSRRFSRHVRHQLLASSRSGHRPILQLSSPRPRRLQAHPAGLLRHDPVADQGDRQARAVRVHQRRQSADRHSRGLLPGKPGGKLPYTLYDLSDRLLQRGWQVPAFALTGEAKDVSVMRVMIRQGVSRDMAALLVEDIKRAIDHFEKHPITVPMTQQEVPVHTHI